jgi:uncharacterized protein YdiU (UPF0061 family)
MPRQAIYTLASREGNIEKKEEIVRSYQGQTKEELISLIRAAFPLQEEDRRRENIAESTIKILQKACLPFENRTVRLTRKQKQKLSEMLRRLAQCIENCEMID